LFSLAGLIVGLISPSLVIWWGNKKTRAQVLLTYGLAMIAFSILSNVTTTPVEKEKEKLAATPSANKEEKIVMPKYSVLDEEIYDAPIKTQVGLTILVSGEISEPGLRALLNKLYFSIKARRGFKYHDSPTNIYIWAFTSKERFEAGMGQWIAMLEKSYYDVEPTIRINERQIAQLSAKPEQRFGLSEEKRKEIWKELVLLERRARKEAKERYPIDPTQSLRVGQTLRLSKRTPLMPELEPADPLAALRKIRRLPPGTTIRVLKVGMKLQTPWYFVEAEEPFRDIPIYGWINSIALMGQSQIDPKEQLKKQLELEDKLNDKYKDKLAKKYGLTREQLLEISAEAFVKDWPFPK
jgi:hypothetical protein